MRKGARIALWTTAAIVILSAAAMFGYMSWVGAPTSGPAIGRYDRPQTALLVIDLQEDFTGPDAIKRMKSADSVVLVAGKMAAMAVGNGQPVAYIRAIYNDPGVRFIMGGLAAPDEPGSRMDRRLPSAPVIRTFTKSRGDAFSNPSLDAWLRENQVNHVVVTGIDAFYCVDDTIHGALNRGYKVTAVMDAISTGTSRDITRIAEKWAAAGVVIQ